MRKKRSDYRGDHMYSFKQEIRKAITQLNKTLKQIGRTYFKDEVKRLQRFNPDKSKREINAMAREHMIEYVKALNQSDDAYGPLYDTLYTLKDFNVDSLYNKEYIMSFIDTSIGKTGWGFSSTGRWNIEVLRSAAARVGGDYNKISELFQGLTPEQIERFAEALVDWGVIKEKRRFFYDYLDNHNVSNNDIMNDILQFMIQENISNDIVDKLKVTPNNMESIIPMSFKTYEDYATHEYIKYFRM